MKLISRYLAGHIQWIIFIGIVARLPEAMQRDLNIHLDAIYATIIINAERLKEIVRKAK